MRDQHPGRAEQSGPIQLNSMSVGLVALANNTFILYLNII